MFSGVPQNLVRSHADALTTGYLQLGAGLLFAQAAAKWRTPEVHLLLGLLAVMTLILFRVLRRHAREKGYHTAWAWCALLSIAGSIIVISLPRRADVAPDRTSADAEAGGGPKGPG